MNAAQKHLYLAEVVQQLLLAFPDNRTVNLVFHGHSVPAGYFATPVVNTFGAYPHSLHKFLKERFPNAVINAIVSAVGGEHSEQGETRIQDALKHSPDVLLIDYALNDRSLGLTRAAQAWRKMIEKALGANVRVLLLTPTLDIGCELEPESAASLALKDHSQQIRDLALEYGVGLVDSFYVLSQHPSVSNLMSWVNHPNEAGHGLVAQELLGWFPIISLGGDS